MATELETLQAQNEQFRSRLDGLTQELNAAKQAAADAATSHAAAVVSLERQLEEARGTIGRLEADLAMYRDGAIAEALSRIEETLKLIQAH